MTDARRRAAERAAAQGDVTEAARLLVLRARVGELTATALRLAAYLGDPAALLAVERRETPTRILGNVGSDVPLEVQALAEWTSGLARIEPTAHVRAALAALRLGLPLWARALKGDGRPHRVIERLEAWVHCPCGPCAGVVRLLADELVDVGPDVPVPAMHMGAAADSAGDAPDDRRAAGWVALRVADALAWDRLAAAGEVDAAGGLDASPRWRQAIVECAPLVRAAIREALVPWALTPRALGGPGTSPGDAPGELDER